MHTRSQFKTISVEYQHTIYESIVPNSPRIYIFIVRVLQSGFVYMPGFEMAVQTICVPRLKGSCVLRLN